MKILFVTWDGPQVTYLESLFLPIFHKLKGYGFQFYVLQFSWADKEEIALRRSACESFDVPYYSIQVARRPVALGSFLTALWGGRHIRRLVDDCAIDVVMPRSTLPAMSALLALRGRKEKLVFDADGLPLDERVDFDGLSPNGFVYRFLRDVESQAVRVSDAILTRSSEASSVLFARAGAGTSKKKFFVVTNGRDKNHFKVDNGSIPNHARRELSVPSGSPLVVYVGSLGGKYKIKEMFDFFSLIVERDSSARMLVLTGSKEIAISELKSFPSIKDSVRIDKVGASEVPRYLSAADLGLAFIQPGFSMKAVSAIKVGEYLLCGVPCVLVDGFGGEKEKVKSVSVILKDFSNEAMTEAVNWFFEVVVPHRKSMREKCRKRGVDFFSLEAAVESYLVALKSL
ncbi:MAG: hypothetical protein CL539_14350 [Alcanivorax sp.]|jgi:glycosyltransferase involved in cell wall biosynthesis|uniref:glycosyltransferase family 4 protein n=1 Tax=unclassified Alcanivorax TaxID=2638842 RepID=UPI000C8D27EE|nr:MULTISPECIES: glycosyltransferase family 4 protein [unclassified Alcanivorax]MAC15831.1 hypothetical protein [Alcanivorax sp.]|tara:strand:- start:457 stop:1656 length:1200 start_codon:yes stop_codon:yes gene_type:complete